MMLGRQLVSDNEAQSPFDNVQLSSLAENQTMSQNSMEVSFRDCSSLAHAKRLTIYAKNHVSGQSS